MGAFAFSPADGSRGGSVTAWNLDVVAGTDVTATDHCLTVTFSSASSNYSFTITNVYAPSDHRESRPFLDEFHALAQP